MAGRHSRAPRSRREDISGRMSASERIGQNPETTSPGCRVIDPAAATMPSDASMRQLGSSASRRANAACRNCRFTSFGVSMRVTIGGSAKQRQRGNDLFGQASEVGQLAIGEGREKK
jgi:hypothetical protein